jgi:hypothetical protein
MLRYAEDTSYAAIDPTQSGKWAKNLSIREVRTFEAITVSTQLSEHRAPMRRAPPE